MSIGVTIAQAALSILLTLAPARVLRKDRLRVSVVLSFLAIFATSKVGGLLFGIPVTIFLALFFMWVRFVGHGTGTKRILFFITLGLSALFLAQHVVHLPIRLQLNQPEILIKANIAGIFLAAAMFGAMLEFLIMTKQQRKVSPTVTPGADQAS